jgi:hypothetical protein
MADRFVDPPVRPGLGVNPLSVMFVGKLLERCSAEIKVQAVKRAREKEAGIILKI